MAGLSTAEGSLSGEEALASSVVSSLSAASASVFSRLVFSVCRNNTLVPTS